MYPLSAEEIRKLREHAKLSQAEAAKMVRLSNRVRWTEYETGRQQADDARTELFLLKLAIARLKMENLIQKTIEDMLKEAIPGKDDFISVDSHPQLMSSIFNEVADAIEGSLKAGEISKTETAAE